MPTMYSCLHTVSIVCTVQHLYHFIVYKLLRVYVQAGLIGSSSPGTNPGLGAKLCRANSGTSATGLISWAVNCHQAV